ncbi:DUF397 domain-containing protein [Actinomadura atramentaria]|uniref:DUF397 domain-containing protein n=1 Tax=Actinomadura atramentaria TaxID=1990 RepID=UPI00037E82EC|nr:DUF397 domain-containing protein [Actinomadura atramentaria]
MEFTALTWRKSTHSGHSGDCVELAFVPATAAWRKSTHSGDNGGHCVELAAAPPQVAIRDSKNPEAGHLFLARANFRDLVERIRTT